VAAGLDASALSADEKLTQFAGRVSDSGEGRWTIKAAIDEGVPVPVLTTALYERFASAEKRTTRTRCFQRCALVLAGHLEKPAAKKI
jgi:6-phosphogluconate dehydrogenase